MPASFPDTSLTRRSIEIYLREAYEGTPPEPANSLIRSLAELDDDAFFTSDAFELEGDEHPRRWSLRLGNAGYPYMKFRIDTRPDGEGFLYSVDTHDDLGLAPGSPDYAEFRGIMEANKSVASSVESAWEAAGVPTFKSWLLADLARRRGLGDG